MEGLTSASGGTNADQNKDASTANGYYIKYNADTGNRAIYKHATNDWYILMDGWTKSYWVLSSTTSVDSMSGADTFLRRTGSSPSGNPYSAEGVTWYIPGYPDATVDGTATAV